MGLMKHAWLATGWACVAISAAGAADTLKVVTGHGVWDTYPTEFAVQAGLFTDADPSVELAHFPLPRPI